MYQDKHQFFSDCVGWPEDLVTVPGGLCDCIDEEDDITIEQFLAAVDYDHVVEFTHGLHYTGPTKIYNDPEHPKHNEENFGMSMEEDYHVSYHRSKLLGKEVFYFKHSGIEHVYIPTGWTPSVDDIDWGEDVEEDHQNDGPGLAV